MLYLGLLMIACLYLYLQKASFSLGVDSKLHLTIKRMDILIMIAPFIS